MRTLLLIGMLLTCAATNVWGQTSDTQALDLMPSWTPGSVQGVPVKVRYTLPIRFHLGK